MSETPNNPYDAPTQRQDDDPPRSFRGLILLLLIGGFFLMGVLMFGTMSNSSSVTIPAPNSAGPNSTVPADQPAGSETPTVQPGDR